MPALRQLRTNLHCWLLTLCLPVAIANAEPRLHTPGTPLTSLDDAGIAVADVRAGRWQSVQLEGARLRIGVVRALRASDVEVAQGGAGASWFAFAAPSFKSGGDTLDLPEEALFGLYLVDPLRREPLLADGEYASALEQTVVLRAGLHVPVRVNGNEWTLTTRPRRQADGRLLAGSMQLIATDSGGHESVLFGPASHMAFQRQELLWLGDLDGDRQPDALLKRTWLSGQYEYLLRIGGRITFAYVDTDHPYQGFSSGIEESVDLQRPRQQRAAPPPARFGRVALSIDERRWNAWLATPATTAVIHYDQSLRLGGETLRFTVESLPLLDHTTDAHDSSTVMWGGSLLLRVHFRGRSQVLMHLGSLDGSGLRIQADAVDGQPALKVEFMPHYNNGFEHYWHWSGEDTPRFRRWAILHSQGC